MDPELAPGRPQREVDAHVFRAGVLAGALAFVAFVGVFKDIYVLVDPGRRGWQCSGGTVTPSSAERVRAIGVLHPTQP